MSAEDKRLFERAAALTGRSTTGFVVSALPEVSHRMIREHETMQVTKCDWRGAISRPSLWRFSRILSQRSLCAGPQGRTGQPLIDDGRRQGADWVTEPLSRHDDRSAFASGSTPLDQYLRGQTGQDARRRLAAPFVLRARGRDYVIGYYTLSAISFDVGVLPKEATRRLPAYPEMPAILLGCLVIDQASRGHGLGGWLLVEAPTVPFRHSY